MNFETYMTTINSLLLLNYNMEVQDLPDEPFMDYYDDGLTCTEVVKIMRDRNLEVSNFLKTLI